MSYLPYLPYTTLLFQSASCIAFSPHVLFPYNVFLYSSIQFAFVLFNLKFCIRVIVVMLKYLHSYHVSAKLAPLSFNVSSCPLMCWYLHLFKLSQHSSLSVYFRRIQCSRSLIGSSAYVSLFPPIDLYTFPLIRFTGTCTARFWPDSRAQYSCSFLHHRLFCWS